MGESMNPAHQHGQPLIGDKDGGRAGRVGKGGVEAVEPLGVGGVT